MKLLSTVRWVNVEREKTGKTVSHSLRQVQRREERKVNAGNLEGKKI